MQFDSLAAFLAMGEHGIFVWSSYAVFVLVLIVNVVQPLVRKRTLTNRLQRLEKRRAAERSGPVNDQRVTPL